MRLKVVSASAATREDLDGPVLFAGTSGLNGVIERHLAATPYPAGDRPGPGEALRVTSINPWDPNAMMIVTAAIDDATVLQSLDRAEILWPHDYVVARGDLLVRYGTFAKSQDGYFRLDPGQDTDLRRSLSSLDAGPVRAWFVRAELAESAARREAERAATDLRSFLERLGAAGPRPLPAGSLELVLHAGRESKAIRTGDPRDSHLWRPAGAPPRVHMVVRGDGAPGDRLGLARAALAIALGELGDLGEMRGSPLADGTAMLLAGGLIGRDLNWWRARLIGSGSIPPAETLLEEKAFREESYLIGMPAAALAARFILDTRGPRALTGALRDKARQRDLIREFVGTIPAGGPRARKGALPPEFQKGVGLAHEGYSVVDGYGSSSSAASMAHLKSLGAGWIALSPYAFMRDPGRPEVFFQHSETQPAGTENDWAVLADIERAHQLGLKVMLKPQVWLSGSHWTGDVEMKDEAGWRGFFSAYREFLTHYALLAAAGDADMLVIGVELQATTSRREADWRALIATARSVYDGPLTYAANWGGEFENLPFWDALDYAGLDCYYPLSADLSASDEEIARGAREAAGRAEAVARRTGRPIILTEVGFPAVAAAWTAPHDEETGRAFDPAAQARGYRAILAAFWDRPWLAGLYWWKWPTTPPGLGSDPSFSPRGRPAEQVLAEWYGRARTARVDWPIQAPDWTTPTAPGP
jgi:hypothetical protein